ncbi:hypothetical protein LQZ39_07975 [Enterobacter cloacae complex sp. RIVM_C039474]|uniref:protein acetyllysine N-acetyltransferase n=1 Tax=Enterobacter roggenkampii TaxID=1812935 RepID=A0A837LEB2_9ENTR|nr:MULTISPECIES: Sir2 family NAD-dependent protein deacetylase [Enterobacteriaceae]EGL2796182.1 hypothetical protein [Salmonella enterica]ELA1562114.1 hypothetical protein [Klebsiella pneumoniae]HDK6616690.1 hypothetical protein [Klebsiella variicola]EEH95967.1 hypothetical protein CSAG_04321 [Citrobacter portucalensis]EHF2823804.1 hypothetical protein [Salmonella enterica]
MDQLLYHALTRIQEADAVIIGASNGFSIASGIHLFASDSAFWHHFGDFGKRHGFASIIQGCFHHYTCEAEYWAFYSRLFDYFINVRAPGEVMENLLALVNHKKFFVLTSNIDGHFVKAGLEQEHLFEIEGSGLNLQCANACHDRLYSGAEQLSAMAREQQDGRVPDALIPCCPVCGGKMRVHVEVDSGFLKGMAWNESFRSYRRFLAKGQESRTVFMELGVGARNQLIKAPFMQNVYQNPESSYITFNKGTELFIPAEIAARSVGIDGDIGHNLAMLALLSS